MLRARVLTATVLLVFLAVVLFRAPGEGWRWTVLALCLLSAWEWAGLVRMQRGVAVLYVAFTALLIGGVAWEAGHDESARWLKSLFLLSVAFWVGVVPFWLARGWRVVHPVPLAMTGWVVILPTGFSLLVLRLPGPWVLLMFMALVWFSDTAAYFAGRRWGRHKLAPSISPGKTWEGVAGALFVVACYALLLRDQAKLPVLRSIIDSEGALWVPLMLGLAILGVEGDLFESWVKRCAGVKDSGRLLPGHGGILDRIDALTSTLPMVAWLMLENSR